MKKLLLLLSVLFFAISACQQFEDDAQFLPDLTEEPTDLEPDSTGPDGGEEGSLTLYRVDGNAINKIKDYTVSSDLLPYQQDQSRHQEIWNYVTRLLPQDARNRIVEFEIFHGGGGLLGYVHPIDEQDLSKWRFALAIDAANDLSQIDFQALFTFVVLHEYAHIMTLNESQVAVTTSEANCSNFYTGEGCSSPNSYINRLFQLGWADIYNSHDHENPEATYNRYSDRFVSEYAATNPGEDVAEVFSFFVTMAQAPSGNSIADQKIKLLYEYPELVDMRRRIRANGGEARMRPGSLGTQSAFQGLQLRKHKSCVRH